MTTTPMSVNLDKLRNAVQKFGAMSFTTSQLAADYQQGDSTAASLDPTQFEPLLHRHATLLGIAASPSSAGGDTVWKAC